MYIYNILYISHGPNDVLLKLAAPKTSCIYIVFPFAAKALTLRAVLRSSHWHSMQINLSKIACPASSWTQKTAGTVLGFVANSIQVTIHLTIISTGIFWTFSFLVFTLFSHSLWKWEITLNNERKRILEIHQFPRFTMIMEGRAHTSNEKSELKPSNSAPWLRQSIKNWMGPNPNKPPSVSCDRGITDTQV